ncbi:MAG: transcription-repair coupling factor, partial [Pseudolysinimonas sp.]
MALERLITALSRARTLETALHEADNAADFSLVDGMRVPLLAALIEKRAAATDGRGGPQTLLAVTATSREAEGVRDAFRSYLPGATVLALPAWETLPHERLSPSAETVGARLKALRTLDAWQKQSPNERQGHLVVVASVRAA